MNKWGLGILGEDKDLKVLDSIFDSKLKQPLKERVVRLRLMVWEQKQRKKKSEETKNGPKDGSEQPEQRPSDEELEEDWETDVRLDIPRFPRLVRSYLDAGVLANLINEHMPKNPKAAWNHQRELAVITYCAMELGCTLPPGFQARLMSKSPLIGLSFVGEFQIYKACEDYIDGKPFSFSSIDTRDTEQHTLKKKGISMDSDLGRYTQRPHHKPPGLESIPSEEPAADAEEPPSKRRKVESETDPEPEPEPDIEEYYLSFPPNTCANCGATQGHGTPDLKRCKGCKNTLYCFEGCQRWHWPRHHCTVEQGDEQSAQGQSTDKSGDASVEKTEKTTA